MVPSGIVDGIRLFVHTLNGPKTAELLFLFSMALLILSAVSDQFITIKTSHVVAYLFALL